MPYANNKDADQPAHERSLISVFVIRCLDSISLVSMSEILSLWVVSVAEQDGLSLTWSKTPKTGSLVTELILTLNMFCHGAIQFVSRKSQEIELPSSSPTS